MDFNEITDKIIKASIRIHKKLGPGLFESVYEKLLVYELSKMGFRIKSQVSIPIIYDGITFDEGFRADIIVNDKVIIEVKSVKSLESVHSKQVLTYIRLTNIKLGILLNFNEALLKHGIKRVVNQLQEII